MGRTLPSLLEIADPDDIRERLDAVRASVRPALYDPARGWTADYVRLRFDACKRS